MKPLWVGLRDHDPVHGELPDVVVDLRQQVAVVPEHDSLPDVRAELFEHRVTVEQHRDHARPPCHVVAAVPRAGEKLTIRQPFVVSTRRSAPSKPAT